MKQMFVSDEMIVAMNQLSIILEDLGHDQSSDYYLRPMFIWREGEKIRCSPSRPPDLAAVIAEAIKQIEKEK